MKPTLFVLLLTCISICTSGRCSQRTYSQTDISDIEAVRRDIVPAPVERVKLDGNFILSAFMEIVYDGEECQPYATYLQDHLNFSGKLRGRKGSSIHLSVNENTGLPAEGYLLSVGEDTVKIEGSDIAGLYYGIETFLQLLPENVYKKEAWQDPVAVPCQQIVDYPRYGYRGLHLDVSRTFTEKEGVMEYVDNMARHKLNRFHWHLTDDQGWRIEIKSHPELAQTGGFRGGGSPVRHIFGAWNRRYGGYFTQEDIKEVVEYAAFRNVQIIPEIDLPGHSRAAARVYPEILCPYVADTTNSAGDIRNVWCATREENYRILEDILGEVCELFPSEVIHIGGDEVDPAQWKKCPSCSAWMKGSGPDQLNGYFLGRLNEILAGYGKRSAAWDEATKGGNLSKDVTIHAWQHAEDCRRVLSAGYPTVLMPCKYFYFDMRQSEAEPGLRWAGIFDARQVYEFEPEVMGITSKMQEHILGLEGALWAEAYLTNGYRYKDYQTYPRVCALAEVCWSPKGSRDWNEFQQRLVEHHYPRLEAMDINFRACVPRLKYHDGSITAAGMVHGAELRYTSDGSEPNRSSELYTGPIETGRPDKYVFKVYYGCSEGYPLKVPDVEQHLLSPAYTVTSSMRATTKQPLSMAADNNPKTYARINSTCRPGDWFLWTFRQPMDCESILIQTGYTYMEKFNVPLATIEVSYDGTVFETVDQVFCTYGTIYPLRPLKAIKMTALTDNGEDAVFIQDLIIKSK